MKPIIIYPPTIEWDYLYQRPQQLLKALSQLGCACVFCNPNVHKYYSSKFYYLSDNLVLANTRSFREAVEWARTIYPCTPLVAYFTYPPHIKQVQETKPDIVLFDSVDEPSNEFASWLPYYSKAVELADIITASANSLANRAQHYARSEVHLLPNACDYTHFQAAQVQQPIHCKPFSTSKPVIGYIGAIAPWLDWSLINVMAHYLTNFEFVFIGPLILQNGISLASKNMHYLGPMNYADLPRYMSNFNYCLIPFKLTPMTQGINPIKFWEYLASGKQILSTKLPEIPVESVIPISEEMFPGFLPGAAKMNRDARINMARDNSWTKRAIELLEIIQSKLEHG